MVFKNILLNFLFQMANCNQSVCMYAYSRACVCARERERVSVYASLSLCVCVCVCMCVCVCVYICVYFCMCGPVYGMVHIKVPLLLTGKSSPCGGSGFPLSLSEWSFTMSDAIKPYIKCAECVVK